MCVTDHVTDQSCLTTEQRNPRSTGLDQMSTMQILRLINEEDRLIPLAVGEALPRIAEAVDLIVEKLLRGGSVVYVGAGTSGRLGVLDAAECQPTFGVGPETISAIIAGGREAVFHAIEESEDDEESGERCISEFATPMHVIVGISASGVTPYVRGALRAARSLGAATVAIVCNQVENLGLDVDVVIPLIVGPEVLTGSTRMKAGTAQKLVLNMLSTASMVKLGKVYDNLMVDMRPMNNKLRARAIRIISMATGLDLEQSSALLERGGGNTKAALVMALAGVGYPEAAKALGRARGHVRTAVELAREGR
ncbi:MAG: N-acetylmuramic acid 6-phosphate etherase [Bacillota bacterium]